MVPALIIEFVFVLAFAQALYTYLRSRDSLQRDVIFVISAMAALVAIDLYRRLAGEPPELVRDLLVAAMFAQPYLTLRLVGRLRPVPRPLHWAAAAGYLVTLAPLIVLPQPIARGWVLSAIGVYVVTSSVAAQFLIVKAGARTGSPRIRLRLAAAATALTALALLVLAVGVAVSAISDVTTVAARGVVLVATFGYLLAFMPPAALRRLWTGGIAYAALRELLFADDESAVLTWHRYAATVRRVSGVEAVVVLVAADDGVLTELATAGHLDPVDPALAPSDGLAQLLAAPQPIDLRGRATRESRTVAGWYSHHSETRFIRAAPIPMRSRRPGALLLLDRHRNLFADDDARMLADIGGQVAVLAERTELRAKLAGSVSGLQAASQAKTDFLSTMSHELRTPLNTIIGFSDLMRAEPLRGVDRSVPADWIDSVFNSGQHLLSLINDVLDLAKVEAGRIELHPREFTLRVAVGEVTGALQPLIDRKKLHLETRIPALYVTADPIRFRQILDNLLSNAIKFTPDGGWISVSASRVGTDIVISVSDSGVGIDVADRERVFEQFQQAGAASGQQAGTGLGLALARRLVVAHGGGIELTAEPGGGSRFTVRLPAEAREFGAGIVAPIPEGRGGILVVEDDPNAANLLRTHLESAGYQVSVAPSGEAGLALARQSRPDAILLDVLLPGMTGWEVLRHLKDDGDLHDVPVFIVTVVDERATAEAAGATDLFVKPVRRQHLLAQLAEHVLSTAPSDRPAVLLIDDDPAALDVVQTALHDAGAHVTTTADPIDGLRLIRTRPFDMVITDLAVSSMDSFDLAAAMREDPIARKIPVLLVTSREPGNPDRSLIDGKVIGLLSEGTDLPSHLRECVDRITASLVAQATQPPDPPL